MPRQDIWIRKEDWLAWQAIKDKPEWLHEALTGTVYPPKDENHKLHERVALQTAKELAEHTFGKLAAKEVDDRFKGIETEATQALENLIDHSCSHEEFKDGHCNTRTCPNFWRNYDR